MKASRNELLFATANESKSLTAYPDGNGIMTIGIGHTKDVKAGMRITNAQAMQFLAEDMAIAEAAVDTAVKNPLQQHEFDMLVDITFNAGPKFISDPEVQGAIASGNKNSVAGLFLHWALDNGVIQEGLLRRAAMRGRIYAQGYTSANLAWINKHKL